MRNLILAFTFTLSGPLVGGKHWPVQRVAFIFSCFQMCFYMGTWRHGLEGGLHWEEGTFFFLHDDYA